MSGALVAYAGFPAVSLELRFDRFRKKNLKMHPLIFSQLMKEAAAKARLSSNVKAENARKMAEALSKFFDGNEDILQRAGIASLSEKQWMRYLYESANKPEKVKIGLIAAYVNDIKGPLKKLAELESLADEYEDKWIARRIEMNPDEWVMEAENQSVLSAFSVEKEELLQKNSEWQERYEALHKRLNKGIWLAMLVVAFTMAAAALWQWRYDIPAGREFTRQMAFYNRADASIHIGQVRFRPTFFSGLYQAHADSLFTNDAAYVRNRSYRGMARRMKASNDWFISLSPKGRDDEWHGILMGTSTKTFPELTAACHGLALGYSFKSGPNPKDLATSYAFYLGDDSLNSGEAEARILPDTSGYAQRLPSLTRLFVGYDQVYNRLPPVPTPRIIDSD